MVARVEANSLIFQSLTLSIELQRIRWPNTPFKRMPETGLDSIKYSVIYLADVVNSVSDLSIFSTQTRQKPLPELEHLLNFESLPNRSQIAIRCAEVLERA